MQNLNTDPYTDADDNDGPPCPECGAALTAGDRTARFCPECGAKLPRESWQDDRREEDR